MQYALCAHYDGTDILIDVFNDPKEAEHCMQFPYYVDYGDEKDKIFPDEMWIEPYEQIPFADPPSPEEVKEMAVQEDELPF